MENDTVRLPNAHIHNFPMWLQSETRLPIKHNSVIIHQSLNIYGPAPTIPHLSCIICQQKWFSLRLVIHLENYRGTSYHRLLCSLYCYHRPKSGKQKSSVYSKPVLGGRQTHTYPVWELGRGKYILSDGDYCCTLNAGKLLSVCVNCGLVLQGACFYLHAASVDVTRLDSKHANQNSFVFIASFAFSSRLLITWAAATLTLNSQA